MTGKGFTIRQLVITGDNVDRASVEFSSGLNVIAYMSQTGKSYILECIDYMLGGKTAPRDIKQSKGYDTIWMEIADATGQVYVLQRLMTGGAFRLYQLALADLKSDSPSTRLATTNSAKTSASAFFLRLSGFPMNVKLKNNAKNAKSNLSFRTISHFFVVNEISMIDDPSPIQTRQGFAVTIERSAFKFSLTGQDDTNLEELEPATAEQVADRVRREVYDELISQLDTELTQLRGQQARGLNELDALIETTSAVIEQSNAEIRRQEGARREGWLASLEAESRLLVLNELLSRFRLLRSHYDSDLQRLDFISEGQHFLDQLETIACPLCGSTLDESPAGDNQLSIASVEGAYALEAEKIRTHVNDLEGTVGVLQQEQAEVTTRLTGLRNRVAEINQHLATMLAPQIAAAKKQVRDLIRQRSQLLFVETLEARLTAIREIRAGMADPAEEPEEEPADTRVQIDDQVVTEFCEMMRVLLERWHFLPPKAHVVFDTAKFDFVVDGQARKNNGKGVRAIIHAAFNIALMRFCLEKDRAHPHFVILDSPLTTFKERGQTVRAEDVDEVSGEVQTAFFEDLATVKANEQIIVIENKQPPLSIKDRSTYVQFVGYEIPGRSGFFPVAK